MLIGYQNKIIKCGWAYYHHYVDTLLYSKIPFGYRMTPNLAFLLFNIFSILFNINEFIFGFIYIIATIDYIAHEYNHSYRKKHYTSFNPFSGKFIGIYIMMYLFEYIGIVDTKTFINT